MANVKVTALSSLAAGDSAATDVLPIVDVSADATKKLAISDLHRSVPDGTLSAPGIAFQSDLNSGLYRSGTDAIALVTNGAARILIDATGNVTIPNDLTVQGATTFITGQTVLIEDKNIELGVVSTPTDVTADGGGITLKGTTDKTIKWISSTNAWTFNKKIIVQASSSTVYAELATGASALGELVNLTAGSTATQNVSLNLRPSNGGTETQGISIRHDGKVGIGTEEPSVNLHVAGTEPQVYIQDSNSTGNNVNATIQFRDSSNAQQGYLGFASTGNTDLYLTNAASNGALQLGTGNTTRLTITSTGNAEFGGNVSANDGILVDGGSTLSTGIYYRDDSNSYGLALYSGGSAQSNRKVFIKTDGTATFASTLTEGGAALNGTAAGVQLYPTGGIHACQASGSSTILSGYIQGSSTKNVAITAGGSATFEGTVDVNALRIRTTGGMDYNSTANTLEMVVNSSNVAEFTGGSFYPQSNTYNLGANSKPWGNTYLKRVLAIGAASGDKVWSGYLTNTAGAATSFINADGSATFAGEVKVEGSSTPTGLSSRISKYGSLLIGTSSDAVGDARMSVDSSNGNITSSGSATITGQVVCGNTSSNVGHGVVGLTTTAAQAAVLGRNTGSYGVNIEGRNGSNTPTFIVDNIGRTRIGPSPNTGGMLNVKAETGLYMMDLQSSADGSGYVAFRRASGTITGYLGNANGLVVGGNEADFALRAQTHLCFSTNGNTERMRIDSSGTVLIGGTSTADNDHAHIDSSGTLTVRRTSGTSDAIIVREGATLSYIVDADGRNSNFNVGTLSYIAYDEESSNSSDSAYAALGSHAGSARITAGHTGSSNTDLIFYNAVGGSETGRAQLSHQGYLSVGGWWTGDKHRLNGNNATQGTHFCTISGYQASGGSSQDTVLFYAVNASGSANSSASAMKVYRNDTTLRSINAAGTVNTSGNDYAEYMVKAGDFTLAKGDICGINAQGKLTNVFADAVAFAVKSTDPSYVGGDTWSASLGEEPGGYSDTRTEEEIAAAKVVYQENLEAVRQTVDRIAFSGQVPVNVTGATPGQHIIPAANEDGSISGIAKSEADLTLAEYMSSVGKVIAVEDDGRAKIIVKVA